jgi:hypothetical protein
MMQELCHEGRLGTSAGYLIQYIPVAPSCMMIEVKKRMHGWEPVVEIYLYGGVWFL